MIELIREGKPIPSAWKARLFDPVDQEFIEATKVYQLVYKGKTSKEEVIARTPTAPFQEVRDFNSDNSFPDGWRNMLIYGDNLLALKTLYDDQRGENRYKTRNKIKLIYIDPPFATKQDFMKDREKAYRDKVIGSQFIEFLRKRLILLREILAHDGSIYVHLDWKKGHYIKAIMDEVFGEHNFLNHIAWCYKEREIAKRQYNQKQDYILFYSKNKTSEYTFNYQDITLEYSIGTFGKYTLVDEKNRKFQIRGKGGDFTGKQGLSLEIEKEYPELVYRDYLDEKLGILPRDWWADISFVNRSGTERRVTNAYPTQKPEQLLERIIKASSKENNIVLDAFAGSGTTLAVAEKLGRRWIGMDCGKLAIYTVQKRMLDLTSQVGSLSPDSRREHERVSDFSEHSKAPSQGLFMTYEKARKGELDITASFLKDFSEFINKHVKQSKDRQFSLVCPREKFKVRDLKLIEKPEKYQAGEYIVPINGITFLISTIQPKKKKDKPKHLKAGSFVLFNAGVYDNDKIKEMRWEEYKPFVMKLFEMRAAPHKIHAFEADGYIGTDSACVWNYPDSKKLVIDEEYVRSLHKALGGKAGDRFYIIAPVVSMGFMMDEIPLDETTYVFLKVPISILLRLLNTDEAGAIKQPVSENNVNEVIDAVGFDFISQPIVKTTCCRLRPVKVDLLNRDQKDYVIRLKEFRTNTLSTDPEDFENFETLSMVLIDTDFRGDIFRLSKAYWAEDLIRVEFNRLKARDNKVVAEEIKACKYLDVRIPETEFVGKKIMAIFMDKYGNEKKKVFTKSDFR